MRYFITLLCFHLIILSSCSSETGFTITSHISGLPDSKIFLASIRGDAYKIIDTAYLKKGVCIFSISNKIQTGMLKIIPEASLKQESRNKTLNYIDIIFNNENVNLKSVYPFLQDSLGILESKENKIYYDYLKKTGTIQSKLDLIQPLLAQYPVNDEFYTSIVQKYNSLQNDKQNLIKQTTESNKGTYAAKLIAMQQSPYIDAHVPELQQQEFNKQHYFEKLDFSDERLINSNAYTHNIVQYLLLYRNPKLTQPELEKQFMLAVDTILAHVNQNDKVYDFILSYLMDGFEKFNMQAVQKHIVDNYTSKTCESNNKNTLQRRLDAGKMIPGSIAPDISTFGLQHNEIRLSKLSHNYILLVFWASWCPNCEETLPQIKKWYESKSIDLEVLAISIDTLASDWKKAISKNSYNWLNACDLKGWDGKASQDYNLYATPTMFLLDRNRKIIAKPISYEEFNRVVYRLQ